MSYILDPILRKTITSEVIDGFCKFIETDTYEFGHQPKFVLENTSFSEDFKKEFDRLLQIAEDKCHERSLIGIFCAYEKIEVEWAERYLKSKRVAFPIDYVSDYTTISAIKAGFRGMKVADGKLFDAWYIRHYYHPRRQGFARAALMKHLANKFIMFFDEF